jgi:hypothetical protein
LPKASRRSSVAASLNELAGAKLDETLAGIVVLLLVLIPYFAIRVLSEAVSEGRLARMFIVERECAPRVVGSTTPHPLMPEESEMGGRTPIAWYKFMISAPAAPLCR